MAKDIRIIPSQGQINVTGSADFKGNSASSVLFVSASGEVGVNTTSPAVTLDVAGQFRASSITGNRIGDGVDTTKPLSILNSSMSDDSLQTLSLGRSNSNNNQAEISFYLASAGSSDNRLSLGLYNSNQTLNITGHGNVGIGTVSPVSKLNIVDSTNSYIRLQRTSGTNQYIDIGTNNGGEHFVYGYGDYPVLIGTNGNTRMTITSAGNIGVGTAGPTAKLEVYQSGSTAFDVQGSQGQLFSVTDNLVGSLMSVNDISGIPILEVFDTDKVVAGQFGTNALVVTGSKVGIGTDAPFTKLHVDAGSDYPFEVNSTQDYMIGLSRSGTDEWWLKAYTDGRFAIHENGVGDQVTIKAGGNVGIGTATPSQDLHVFATDNGDGILIESDPAGTNRAPALKLYPKSSLNTERNWALSPYKDTPQGLSIASSDAKGGDPYSAGTTRMLIDGISGNVGIGTTSPVQKLDVDGNIQILDTNASDGDILGYLNFHSTTGGSSGNHARIAGIRDSASAGQMSFYVKSGGGPKEKMRINSDGNVGISTNSPTAPLEVYGQGALNYRHIYVNSTETIGAGLTLQTSGSSAYSFIATGDGATQGESKLLVYRDGVDGNGATMTFDSNGRVGIGTTNPAYHIHATSAESGWGYSFQNATGDEDVNVYMSHGGGYGIAVDSTENATNKYLLKLAGGTGGGGGIGSITRMIVTSAGNVGIGTGSPAVRIHGVTNEANGQFRLETTHPSGIPNLELKGASSATIRFTSGSSDTIHSRIDFRKNGLYILGDGANNQFIVKDTGVIQIPDYGSGNNTGTPTYTLQVDASGNIIENPIGAGTLDGLGSAQYITRWEDTDTLTTSSLYESTSGNIGVGMTDPKNQLSVGAQTHYSPDDTNRILNWYTSTSGTEIGNSDIEISVGNYNGDTSQPKAIGLALYNNYSGSAKYAPAISFGGLSESELYMNGGAAISAQLFTNAEDNNFLAGDLTFYTQGNTQAARGLTEKMRITNTGNMGIGTSAPLGKLHVVGGGGNGTLYIEGTSYVSHFNYGTNEDTYIRPGKAAGNVLIADVGSNVGIGTSDPSAKLDVNKAAVGEYAYLGSGGTRQLRFSSYDTVSAHAGHQINASSGNGELKLATAGVAAITIDNSQNVTMAGDLTVGGIVTAQEFHTEFVSASIVYQSGSTQFGNSIDDGHTFTGALNIVDGNATAWGLPQPGRDNLGGIHLGLDTTTDNAGSAITFGARDSSANTRANAGIYVRTDGSYGTRMYFGTTDSYTVGSKIRMTIDHSGNVGIGTTDPSALLDVTGTGNYATDKPSMISEAAVSIKPVTGSSGNLNFASVNGGAGIGLQYTNYAGTANWDIALQPFGGQVGIGTVNPSEALEVNGNVKADRFISSNEGSSGVFEIAYSDQHKRVWTTSLSFSYTAAATYNFNLIFRNSGGYHYDLVATNSRNGLYRNFGTLKDSSYIYWESDGDFEHRAQGDLHLISSYGNGMYFSADPTGFLSDSKTGTSQNGSANWNYYIVRYSIYIPYYVGDATGSWKLHLTTYGDTGGNAPEFVLA